MKGFVSCQMHAKNPRAPSYFTRFFEDQLRQTPNLDSGGVGTLYIDRDPATFRDVARHLQGMRRLAKLSM